MRFGTAFFIFCLCTPLLLVIGCERKEGDASKASAPAGKEIPSKKPSEGAVNVALKKSYKVKPRPTGYAETYSTDATDGRKPESTHSCFGYAQHNAPLDITIDIDLGQEEKINGATLYTFFDKYDEENNECNYGGNYVEVYGSKNGNFSGEEKLLGKAGNKKDIILGEPGNCVLEVEFKPHKCRYVRFMVSKKFGGPATGTDWLFIKEVEVWKAAD